MKQGNFKRKPFRKKPKGPYLKLSREYVEKAVCEYLKSGGKITKLKSFDYRDVIHSLPDLYHEADDFLLNR